MKKFIIITLAAIVAAVILCSATANLSGITSNGTVRFESTSHPALNFSMPASRAAEIFRLMPESLTSVCTNEYAAVRKKCLRSSSFTHEGVRVTRTESDPSLTIVLSTSGYKLTVSDVSLKELDSLFDASVE